MSTSKSYYFCGELIFPAFKSCITTTAPNSRQLFASLNYYQSGPAFYALSIMPDMLAAIKGAILSMKGKRDHWSHHNPVFDHVASDYEGFVHRRQSVIPPELKIIVKYGFL